MTPRVMGETNSAVHAPTSTNMGGASLDLQARLSAALDAVRAQLGADFPEILAEAIAASALKRARLPISAA